MSEVVSKGPAWQKFAIYGAYLAVFLWIAQTLYVRLNSPLNKIPGPGVAKWTNWRLKLSVISGQRIYYVHDLHLKYGPFVRISPTEISVADPEAFAKIHQISSGFNKSTWYLDLVSFERATLFTMNDPKAHATRRRLLARSFSLSYLRQNWESVVRQKVDLVVNKMKEETQKTGAADILKWWTFMATDVSVHLMFGDSFHMIERGEKNEYIRVLESALMGGGIGAEMPIVRAIGKLLPIKKCRDMFAASSFLLATASKAVTGAEAGGQTNLFAHIIDEARKGAKLDDLDLKSEASGLIVGGSDTTAISLTYLVWAVLSRPTLQALLVQEVSSIPEGFSEVDLEKLPVLNGVIEETLRLYGAAPGALPRMVPPEGAQFGKHYCPPGTTVTTQAYTMHRLGDIFPRPLEFDHTRWLNPASSATSGDQAPKVAQGSDLAKMVYSPFGTGSRTCIGLHLARMELRLGAAKFFRECGNARLAASTTPESMEMENFFLIAPKAHSEGGHIEVVERLLAAKADVNAAPAEYYGGRTAIQAAVEGGHHFIVQRLKEVGAEHGNS